MDLIIIFAVPVLVTVIILYLLFLRQDKSQQYPDWVVKAFEEFERSAEEDSKLSEVERVMKYFPDAKITRDGNKTVIDLAGGTEEELGAKQTRPD